MTQKFIRIKLKEINRMEVPKVKKTVYLTSKQDGLKLHVLLMEPEEEPKGIVQIVHGMAEHKERYEPFMEMLCKQGYISIIHDHRGHGKSIRAKEDLGYFYDESGKAIVEDVHQITQWAKDRYGEMPYHLFGHSMGSLVVRCYLKKYDNELDSLIICGSPSENKAAKAAILLAKAACKIRPHKRGDFFQKLAFGLYGKILEEGESENDWISYNKENVKAYDENPLDGFVFSNNGFLNLFLLMDETYNNKGWQVKHPSLPILFIAGADDPCIGSKKQYAKAMTTLKKRGYNNVRGMLFLNRRHEILNEDGVEKVYKAVLSFLK